MENEIIYKNPLVQVRHHLRERSVQKDYQRFIDSKNFWIKYNQDIKQQSATEGCTFKPDIKKSNRKVKSKQTYFNSYYKLGKTMSNQDLSQVNPFDMRKSSYESNGESSLVASIGP